MANLNIPILSKGILCLLGCAALGALYFLLTRANDDARAKSAVKQIANALQGYYLEYGGFNAFGEAEDLKFNTEHSLVGGLWGFDEKINPRGVQFVAGARRDPWGRAYQILIDTSGDGIVYDEFEKEEIQAKVLVYSLGVDGVRSEDDLRSH